MANGAWKIMVYSGVVYGLMLLGGALPSVPGEGSGELRVVNHRPQVMVVGLPQDADLGR